MFRDVSSAKMAKAGRRHQVEFCQIPGGWKPSSLPILHFAFQPTWTKLS